MLALPGSLGITGGDVIAYLHVRRKGLFCGRSNILEEERQKVDYCK